ncbi:MAG: hypothetical protein ACKVP7_02345 [Hyphomicrobiaceae bacterium]
MRTGRQTLASIEETIARLRQEEERVGSALTSIIEDDKRLRSERAAALRELARVKLDEMAAGRLVRNLDAAESRAVKVLEDRRNRLAGLAERRKSGAAEVQAAEAARHAAGGEVERALEAVEKRRAEAENKVKESANWREVAARSAAAESIAKEAETKATASETELGAKKKPYDDDKLFVYLWKSGYGTQRYQAGNFTRMMDRMVADFIGFSNARGDYAMLSEIVLRLREHATAKSAAATEVKTELAAIERAAMVAAGIEADERALAAARHKLAAAEATLDGKRSLLKTVEQEHEAMLSGSGDAAYAEALDTIAAGDSRDDIETLYREARRTETKADEALVARIGAIDDQIARAEQEKIGLRRSAKTVADRRLEIERTRDRFRSAGYDHPHATFGNDSEIGNVLGQILEGAVRSGVLWDVIRGGFSTRAPRGGPTFGNPSFPFPFPLPGGGSSGTKGGGWREPESGGGWFPSGDAGSSDSGGGSSKSDDGFSTGGEF